MGSLIVQLMLGRLSPWLASPRRNGLGVMLLVFAGVMALGALVAWAWLPELQNVGVRGGEGKRERLESKSLEELAEGLERAGRDGEVVGLRRRVAGLVDRGWRWRRKGS